MRSGLLERMEVSEGPEKGGRNNWSKICAEQTLVFAFDIVKHLFTLCSEDNQDHHNVHTITVRLPLRISNDTHFPLLIQMNLKFFHSRAQFTCGEVGIDLRYCD
jgi:hypothetical protein